MDSTATGIGKSEVSKAAMVVAMTQLNKALAPAKRLCKDGRKRHKWVLVRSATRSNMCEVCGWWPSAKDQPKRKR